MVTRAATASTTTAVCPTTRSSRNPLTPFDRSSASGRCGATTPTSGRHLGKPILPEIGFETSILVVNATIEIGELDNRTLQIRNDGTWIRLPVNNTPTSCATTLFFSDQALDVCPAPPITTEAAYQSFEHGFMLWLRNSGDVWVFVDSARGSDRAHWFDFAQSQYARFEPATPEVPPTGRIEPVGAFERVWHNLAGWDQNIRAELGWATAQESTYMLTMQVVGRTSHVHTYLSLPDGRVADAYSGLAGIFWTWVQ